LREELARKDAILLNITEAMKALTPLPQEIAPERREPPETASEVQSDHTYPRSLRRAYRGPGGAGSSVAEPLVTEF